MKKTLVIIVAVAVLGVLGLLANSRENDSPTSNQQAGVSSTATTSPSSTDTQPDLVYKDGSYTKSADTPYGPVKITVIFSGGKIADVVFDDMPNGEDRSAEITAFSSAKLRQSAIDAQSSNIDFVSGATSTSYGFKESLQAALNAAAMS